MRTVHCIKLGRDAEGLDFPPYPGELGKRIYESVSKEAWAAWLKHQTMLVNENRLSLADARARKWLAEQMDKHFFGAFAEEVLVHLLGQPLARTRVGERQTVLVDEHRLVFEPRRPRLLRHAFVDALAELARVRGKVESLGVAAELDAVNGAHVRYQGSEVRSQKVALPMAAHHAPVDDRDCAKTVV